MKYTVKNINNQNKSKYQNTSRNRNKTKSNKTRKNNTFTNSDYNSGDGMLTSVWGPSMWHFLHTMSFNYPINPTNQEKKHYREFILSLQYVLPCKYCRMNLKKNFEKHPVTLNIMKNRETFSKYIYELHEIINKLLHKTSNLSYSDVRERYEHFRSRCTQSDKDKDLLNKIDNKTRKNNKKEKGCTESLYGKKSKCIIKIVPQDNRSKSFQMDKKCIKYRK